MCKHYGHKGIRGSPADDNNHRAPARAGPTMDVKQKRGKKSCTEKRIIIIIIIIIIKRRRETIRYGRV